MKTEDWSHEVSLSSSADTALAPLPSATDHQIRSLYFDGEDPVAISHTLRKWRIG